MDCQSNSKSGQRRSHSKRRSIPRRRHLKKTKATRATRDNINSSRCLYCCKDFVTEPRPTTRGFLTQHLRIPCICLFCNVTPANPNSVAYASRSYMPTQHLKLETTHYCKRSKKFATTARIHTCPQSTAFAVGCGSRDSQLNGLVHRLNNPSTADWRI